ncbi:ergothioneine biosynthesis protein EgtB [Aureivirga marina]|uniref:ergothioneine biosynthesis protein EgtB n=1 Tax=Aureivirga marina TaxID=1182451 RepID=UPI0018C9FDE0|nr:ergothioneine biosynthesis protein EgtB [Aureivirga marina]
MNDLLEKYKETRKETERICKTLLVEDYNLQAAFFVSPAKWHLGHTSWFFEQFVLKEASSNYEEFCPKYSFIFNSYYQTFGEKIVRNKRGLLSRPIVEKVFEYRKYIDQQIQELLEKSISEEFQKTIYLGIQHEQQHQELLLTDIKFNFYQNPLKPAFDSTFQRIFAKNKTKQKWVKIPEGLYTIGHQKDSFCYDNELGVHQVFLQEFEISNQYVTNREYLEFMEDGGYEDFRLWLDEGWNWVTKNQLESPLYWEKTKGNWKQFTLSGEKNLDLDSILCHVSFYEANAFANWKKMRLPTEFEWEIASDTFEWGERWEWTNSAYLPYPNFKVSADAKGEYNGKFMSNQMVLRGSSCVTSKGHSRKTYRNFFHPEESWQFSGIRLVK